MRWAGLAVLGVACSATSLSDDTRPLQGVDAPDATTDACERNFYPDEVVCYPTTSLGRRARIDVDGGVTGVTGDRMPNLKMVGWERIDENYAVDLSSSASVVPMSHFYDPESRRLRVLMILASAAWCAPCVEQTKALVNGWAQTLAAQGVMVLQVLDNGDVVAPASMTDLVTWIQEQKPRFTEVLPNDGFFNELPTTETVPFVFYVDARSMEILQVDVGYDSSFAAAQRWATWVATNPPLSH